MTQKANIIGWDNGGGLSRDIDVLHAALTALGWSVAVNGRRGRHASGSSVGRALGRVRSRMARSALAAGLASPPFDLNLHLEEINGASLALARRNILIPNQEWLRDWCRPYLPRMDEVWVKTRYAGGLFAQLGCKVRLLGWEGVDRRAPGARSLMGLHMAGASIAKGTEAVLDVWSEHPEWPLLRVLRRSRGYAGEPIAWRERPAAPNIQIIGERVDDRTLIRWQNESALHVCPSEAEGFGHNILEAMSVGAVVISTDAPPMNEIVTEGAGLLVAAERSEPMSLGRRYFVSRADLAARIRAALAMTDAEREAMGQAARARFEQNNGAFRARLAQNLESLRAAAAGARSALS